MTHFVVVVPFCTPEIQNKLSDTFKTRGFAWWHWGAEIWLLASEDSTLDAAKLRGIVYEVITAPEVAFLVLRVEMPQSGVNWATSGTLLDARDWATWLRQSWEHPNYKK
jgi:hypothetical protein